MSARDPYFAMAKNASTAVRIVVCILIAGIVRDLIFSAFGFNYSHFSDQFDAGKFAINLGGFGVIYIGAN